MTLEERARRIENTSHIVRLEDSTVYRISGLHVADDKLIVETSCGMMFLDTDVFTLEEAADAERGIRSLIKQI